MKSETYVCDVCKTPKRKTNHWWLMRAESPSGLRMEPWDAAEAKQPDTMHLCGDGCAAKAMSNWMHQIGTVADLERMLR